jgi:hypothetical protein
MTHSTADTEFLTNTFYWIWQSSTAIFDAATALGVPPEAIAGAMAEEYDSNLTDILKVWGAADLVLDGIVKLYDSDSLYNDYLSIAGVPADSLFDKLAHPTANDIGRANIEVKTAIALLEDYVTDYPSSDPLNLKQYVGNYDQFVADIIDPLSPATASVLGLQMKKGQEFFQTNAAEWWNDPSRTDEEKSALLITYSNLGHDRVAKNMDEQRIAWEASHPPEEQFIYTPGIGSGGIPGTVYLIMAPPCPSC